MIARSRPFRNPLIGLVAMLSALVLAGCDPVAVGGGGPRIDARAPVPVALLVPGGSTQGEDEVLARSLRNAAELAASDLDGVEIDLRVYNTAGSAAQAASAATRAVEEGAKIILGPVYAQSANAAGRAAAARNVNVLAFSNNTSIAGGNVFVLGPTFQNTADRLSRFALSRGRNAIMVVHERNVAGEAGRAAITSAVQGAGGRVASVESYEFSQNGVVDAVSRIAGSARSTGADAIFFTADTAGALPLLTQLLPENGVDPQTIQFIGLTRWDIPPATLALPGVQGAWFALPDPQLSNRFYSRYTEAFGEAPHSIAGLAYDAIAAVGALVQRDQSNALTAAALTQASGFVGVNGVFRLRPDGTNQRGLAVAQISNNQVVVIDPAPRSFGGAGY
ncbi:ABC-type branched-subunit amino acid transport system substrate-binding protein [Rhodovulum iodosum]|uniref:ABC-type branched-subunit amino acid transport system substrate-binding protein n=1 Tax=Rhodovulum iodosum TaxID=68291 RepID=A0ABV3XSV8_9RHOB|nr:penicillin-binding protein activator [Rhodovulum robiginosum]RSK30597.1 penicillin-binding protein activator [Rhodovulum robiginosum]